MKGSRLRARGRMLCTAAALAVLVPFGACAKTDGGEAADVQAPAGEEKEPTAAGQTEENAQELPQKKQTVKSFLTGEEVSREAGRRRPVAVMLNNIKAACPQTGISHAGVIYEAPVEGGITRLMGIFEEYDGLEKIGSVRSCRDYFIFYAAGFDAVYCHYGQSVYAEKYLEQEEVDNLSGLSGYGETVYYRTQDRKSPHNVYTSFEGLQKGIEQNGYRREYREDYESPYLFAGEEITPQGGRLADRAAPGGYDYNEAYFLYDPAAGMYERYQFGEPQIDEETGETLAVKNIIFQNSQWEPYDENGYLNIDTQTPGTGVYITNGRAQEITWTKDGLWGQTRYYDSEGNRLVMNPGKTWVCIVLNSDADETVIE